MMRSARDTYRRSQSTGRSPLSSSFEPNRKAVIMKNSATLLWPKCVYSLDGGTVHSPVIA